MNTATQTLRSIESRAERAIVQELRLMTQEVLQLRPSLRAEDRAYADGLLLKLGRLEAEQLANRAVAIATPPVEDSIVLQEWTIPASRAA